MLVRKVERIEVNLNPKNIKEYKKTCREFNRRYNKVLDELLTDRYSLPTRQEWDTLISEINKLREEIKKLKSNKKTEEELFQESLRVFRESQGDNTDTSEEVSEASELANKEERLGALLEYKNNLHILSNNSNITKTTINNLQGGSTFDSKLNSYFQKIVVTSIDRFKTKPKNKEGVEYNKPLAGLPRYRKINQQITLEYTNQSYVFLRNNKKNNWN